MSSIRNKAGLEIDEDIQHQEKVWFIERVSWGIMALLVLAALLGLLGHGPLSSKTLENPNSGLLVQYERFERTSAQTLFRIKFNPAEQRGSEARLSIGQEFLDKVEISSIVPEPVQVIVENGKCFKDRMNKARVMSWKRQEKCMVWRKWTRSNMQSSNAAGLLLLFQNRKPGNPEPRRQGANLHVAR